jgi:hypothetical protein
MTDAEAASIATSDDETTTAAMNGRGIAKPMTVHLGPDEMRYVLRTLARIKRIAEAIREEDLAETLFAYGKAEAALFPLQYCDGVAQYIGRLARHRSSHRLGTVRNAARNSTRSMRGIGPTLATVRRDASKKPIGVALRLMPPGRTGSVTALRIGRCGGRLSVTARNAVSARTFLL